MSEKSEHYLTGVLLFALLASSVSGHGRLVDPPARSTMWRLGFDTPTHYNDHQLFCGGYSRQWGKNHGRCGECGDPWDLPRPRPNEAGGTWGTGVISKVYRQGQIITVTVHLTANHMGWFEFRLCPNNNPKHYVKQSCLNKHVLKLVDYPGTRYELKHSQTGLFRIRLQLPENVICSQCVLQWHYTTGNNWGFCKDGSNQPGCGPQEVFRGCSDVAIFTPDDSTYFLFHNLTREADLSQFLHLNETPQADEEEYDNTIKTDITGTTDGPQTNDINVTEAVDVEPKKVKNIKANNVRNSRFPNTRRPSITFIDDQKPKSKTTDEMQVLKFAHNFRRKHQNSVKMVGKKYVSSDDFRKGYPKDDPISAPTPFLPYSEETFEEHKPIIINPNLVGVSPSPLGPPVVFQLPSPEHSSIVHESLSHKHPSQSPEEYRLVIGDSRSETLIPDAVETTLIIPVQDTSSHSPTLPLTTLQMLSGITSASNGEVSTAGSPVSAMQVPVSSQHDGDAMQRLMILKQVLDLAASSANIPQESPVVLIIA
ncbi:uncharacterized protein LOC135225000 [Macrobrachium nipponense]|uniref:uncharacterized protein LOC135225000 n=1 Tax=Macrobrachium nipponense TaxID=159736 RepID=UPI0030C7A40A